jgi:hypothetical protein
MVPKIPLMRSSCSGGTICGIIACTAGVWNPAPTERTATASRMIQRSVTPFIMSRASARVTIAMLLSETITRTRRFMRSARVPPKIETMPCGRNAATA